MKPRYVIFTNNNLFSFLSEEDWLETINERIKQGYVPLGGTVNFGNHGLMQTMYLPIIAYDEVTKENVRKQAEWMSK